MKKIFYLLLFAMVFSPAQILVDESFEGTSLPTGWTSYSNATLSSTRSVSYGSQPGTPCDQAKSAYVNTYGTSSTQNWYFVYSSAGSNGTDLSYSFNYLAKAYSTSKTVDGTFAVEYSVDGGTTWSSLLSPVTLLTAVGGSIPCTTVSGTIPAASIPTGSSFKLKFISSATGGDYYMGIDKVVLTQTVTSPPTCTTITAPADASVGQSVTPTISWSAVSGTSDYKVTIGTSAGASDVLPLTSAGTALSYNVTTPLMYDSTYYVTVYPSNSNGTAAGCSSNMFTTKSIVCPSVSAPSAGATNLTLKPTITWGSVVGASGYYLSVGTTAGGTDILDNFDVGNNLNYTFSTNLNVSTTYYYTVTAYQGASVSSGCTERQFTTGTAMPPANDDCVNAISLTVNPDLSCTTSTSATTLGASQSMAAAPCYGNPDDDVWFSFVATNSTHIVTLSNVVSVGTTSTTDMYFQVLSGTCGNLTSILCSDSDFSQFSGLTVGETYYVRAYTYGTAGRNCNFDICITTPPPPPTNDDCANATMLTVNPDLNCGASTAGTTVSASQSMAATPCSGTPDDDVWYSFVATNTSHVVTISNVVSVGTSSTTNMYFQVLSGTCGSLTSLLCSDADGNTITGLTVGETYYIRVYTYSSGTGYACTFNICVGTLPPPPANDECVNAVPLTVNTDLSCGTMTAGTTASASLSMAATPCYGNPDDDVWYSFVATETTHVVSLLNVVSVGVSSTTDMYFQVLSGTCGNLTSVVCSDPNSKSVTGLTVGETYYIRVYTYSTGANYACNFNICVGSLPPVPANDDCSNATAITGIYSGSSYTTTQDATSATNNSGVISSCTYGMNDGVWYTVVGDGGDITVTVSNPTGWDPELAVYTGSCGSFTCETSSDSNGSNSGETVTFTSVLGTTYYINIGHYNGTTDNPEGPFTLEVATTAVLGTKEVRDAKDFVVYPNPFTDYVSISNTKDVKAIEVFDLSGRLVVTKDKISKEIYLGDLEKGLYIVKIIYNDGDIKNVKMVKR